MKQEKFSYFTISEKGNHQENEDFVIVERHHKNEKMLVCALADGQGGQSGGAIASKLAGEKAVEIAKSFAVIKLYHPTNWIKVLVEVDRFTNEDKEAGFTTLISFCFVENVICGASCGDSHILYVNDSHSILLTENQKKHPSVGSSVAMPEPFSTKVDSNWKLLAMSDGVWKFLDWNFITETARKTDGKDLIKKLKEETLNRNGNNFLDDFSIILLQEKSHDNLK